MGHEEELLHVICVLLGCNMENVAEGNLIKITSVKNFLRLMKETAFSHLMEVSSLNSVISIFVNDLLFHFVIYVFKKTCFRAALPYSLILLL